MRTHSPFIVDVHELLETPGVLHPLRLRVPAHGLGLADVAVHGDLDLDLEIEAIEGGVYVRGKISGEFAGGCGRCLEPVSETFSLDVAELYRPAGAAWEEGYVINEGTIDLEPSVRDTVGLAVPLTLLCRPDCAGLCARCGADLNAGPCECSPEQGDPRWAALRELDVGGGKANGSGRTVS